jgi:hypothetical protein
MSRVQFVSSISPELDQQLNGLRQRKALTVVAPEKEGTPLATLPDNLFGLPSLR